MVWSNSHLGSLVGAVVGTMVAGIFGPVFGDFLTQVFGRPELMSIIAFLSIFIIVARLVGFAFYMLDEKFDFLKNTPIVSGVDRLVGGGIGFFEGMLVIGISLFVISQAQVSPAVAAQLQASTLVPWFISVSTVLQTFLPKSFTEGF